MHRNLEIIGRDSLLFGISEAMPAETVANGSTQAAKDQDEHCLDLIGYARAHSGVDLDVGRTALVVIDPQIDFLDLAIDTEHRTIQNLARLFEASKHAGITVAISLTSPRDLRSDFLPDLKQYIENDDTVICSPHAAHRQPWINDVGVRLRKQGIGQIILAGMFVRLRIESHLRDFIGQSFEVAVVRDAIAGAKLPEGVGYLSALVNFRCVVNALWTTEETIRRLG